MQHDHWIAQAHQHWKEHRPKAFRRMKADGTLGQRLTEAAEATEAEMRNLMAQGFQHHEAWEQVRETYLFLPEEPGASPEAPPSRGYKAALATMADLASLRVPGDPGD